MHRNQPRRKRSVTSLFPPEHSPIDFTIAPDGSVVASYLGRTLQDRQRPVTLVPSEVRRSWDAQEGFFPRRERRSVRLDFDRGILGGNRAMGQSSAQSNNARSSGQSGQRQE
jgi:hypothetical protein